MGILSFFLKKKYPAIKDFPVLCFTLTRRLNLIRTNWLGESCKLAADESRADPLALLQAGGPQAYLTKGYLVLVAARCITANTYIRPSENKRFSDLLYADAFADALVKCLECLKVYARQQSSFRLHRQVAKDLARSLLQKEAPEALVLQLQALVAIFSELVEMVTAEVFADYKTAKKKEETATALIRRQDSGFSVNVEGLSQPL